MQYASLFFSVVVRAALRVSLSGRTNARKEALPFSKWL
jgi:hypothetical protein